MLISFVNRIKDGTFYWNTILDSSEFQQDLHLIYLIHIFSLVSPHKTGEIFSNWSFWRQKKARFRRTVPNTTKGGWSIINQPRLI